MFHVPGARLRARGAGAAHRAPCRSSASRAADRALAAVVALAPRPAKRWRGSSRTTAMSARRDEPGVRRRTLTPPARRAARSRDRARARRGHDRPLRGRRSRRPASRPPLPRPRRISAWIRLWSQTHGPQRADRATRRSACRAASAPLCATGSDQALTLVHGRHSLQAAPSYTFTRAFTLEGVVAVPGPCDHDRERELLARRRPVRRDGSRSPSVTFTSVERIDQEVRGERSSLRTDRHVRPLDVHRGRTYYSDAAS